MIQQHVITNDPIWGQCLCNDCLVVMDHILIAEWAYNASITKLFIFSLCSFDYHLSLPPYITLLFFLRNAPSFLFVLWRRMITWNVHQMIINRIIINWQLNLESQYLQQHPKLLKTSNSCVFTDSNANTLDTWDIWFS